MYIYMNLEEIKLKKYYDKNMILYIYYKVNGKK